MEETLQVEQIRSPRPERGAKDSLLSIHQEWELQSEVATESNLP